MKTLSLFILTALIVSCRNNSGSPVTYPYVSVHRATDDLQVYEGKWRRQLLANGIIITGKVVNKSNSINYKDVKLLVKYYSVTHTVMAQYYFVVYQYLNAGKLIDIKLKGPAINPQSLGTISVDVADATQY